ncbi:MAG: glycoside hydrolase family 3 N-terminal domain-containing protein [Spirochaetia bacterium]
MKSSKEIREKTEELLSRMTLEEKLGQMLQLSGKDIDITPLIHDLHVGSFLHTLGDRILEAQKQAAKTRLGIPLLFGIDAIHGHAFWPGATVFPTQLAMSCAWDTEIVRNAAQITAKEVRRTGLHWTFSPVFCITRDLRWGRVNETFGEDPYLIGELGAAMVEGYQGNDLASLDSVLACAKHFAGYSETIGGRDSAEAEISHRKMRKTFLPAFKRAVDSGCRTIMAGYNAIDGIPCSANPWLLKTVLRDEWGFNGMVITDWDNLGEMVTRQKVYKTHEEAAIQGILSGNDMIMVTQHFLDAARDAVKSGRIKESLIDDSCRRILSVKYELGLFDNMRYTDFSKKAQQEIGCKTHQEAALEAARKSLVLLKNENNILPLSGSVTKIAVIGPNADNVQAQLGDWSFGSGQADFETEGHPRENITTILDAFQDWSREGLSLRYSRGCDVLDPMDEEIEDALELAEWADIVVLVLGDDLPLIGEMKDRAFLELSGSQIELFTRIKATGVPVVTFLLMSKPLAVPGIAAESDAVFAMFNPGMHGGKAAAEAVFGKLNPEGRLTVSFPRTAGGLPVYYNQIPGWHAEDYADCPGSPLYPFGYGLSYTSFRFRNLAIGKPELTESDTLKFSLQVENTGSVEGTETVQAYVCDQFASVTRPLIELKAFQKVFLKPGETKTVSMQIEVSKLCIVDQDENYVVEPGDFTLFVGPCSDKETCLSRDFTVIP